MLTVLCVNVHEWHSMLLVLTQDRMIMPTRPEGSSLYPMEAETMTDAGVALEVRVQETMGCEEAGNDPE
jgi:hypothetical protein